MTKAKARKYPWYGNYGIEIELPECCVVQCSHSGQCDDDVEYWYGRLNLVIDADKLSKELSEYSDWDVSNHEENVKRLIWLAAGDIRDQEDITI